MGSRQSTDHFSSWVWSVGGEVPHVLVPAQSVFWVSFNEYSPQVLFLNHQGHWAQIYQLQSTLSCDGYTLKIRIDSR